jgi:hypothetical protein
MALLLHAKGRAYLQSASASNAEAQEVRFKENTDLKKQAGKKKRKSLLAGFWAAEGGLVCYR